MTLIGHEESYWGDKTVLTVDYGDGVEVSFLMWENKMSSAQESTVK